MTHARTDARTHQRTPERDGEVLEEGQDWLLPPVAPDVGARGDPEGVGVHAHEGEEAEVQLEPARDTAEEVAVVDGGEPAGVAVVRDAGEADKDGDGEGEADHDGDEEGIELHGHTREPAERVGGAERGEGRHEGAGQDAGASAEEQGVVEVLSGPVLFRF